MMCSRIRYVLGVLFAFCAVIANAASVDAVRFGASPSVVQMRIEVRSAEGALLYDSEWKDGNVLDWPLQDSFGHSLAYGAYRVRMLSKDLAGQTTEKESTLRVEPGGVAIDGQPNESLKITLTAHDGEVGQIVTTSGDLSFRFGDFLTRKDIEVMRLTAQGDLDVVGIIHTSKGIMFPDGSIQRSAAMPSIVRMRPSNPESDKKLKPKSDISGAGTTNQVTKWLDGPAGTVGDSAINEVGGKVGIGTLTPGGQLHIYGVANTDVFAGMGPDVISGPGFNYGYAGNSFGVGAGFFNVRPAAGAIGVNPSLRFMTVDQQRMIITNAGNVGIGTSSPGQKLDVAGTVNVAGNLALPSTSSASTGVITLGGMSFAHSFGTFNAFMGNGAGNFLMSGTGNVGAGDRALQNNTTGLSNTAIGAVALPSNTTGSNNTASGQGALNNNTSGNNNTASGNVALINNTTGSDNTASGAAALFNNTTGSSNIALGLNAGLALTTGDFNIDIGHPGVAAEASTIRIGTAQTRAFIAGIRGATTGAANAINVLVDANGQLGTVSSSRRYKFDIGDMGEATAGLMRLRPVTFRYLAHGDGAPQQYGLIAEEVAEVYPELVARNKDGEVETVMYQFLAPMLLNEVQKQQKTIDALQKEHRRIEETLNATVASLGQRLQVLERQLANSGSR